MSRIDKTIESLAAVKNLTASELLAVLQALNEKTKSSQDFAGKDEREYFCEGMFDDQIADVRYYMSLRNEAADCESEDEVFERRFGFLRRMAA